MKFKACGKSVIGGRDKNQDAFLIFPEKHIYAVADGVGGGLKGEVASKMAVDHLKSAPDVRGRLREAVEKGQQAILKEAHESIGEPLMGTTLTAVRLWEDMAELVHVGDSRCYLFSGDHLKLLTEDHEIFDETLQSPVLASYLGLDPEIQALTIQEEMIPLAPGEKLLLCSDGLYKQMSENRMLELLKRFPEEPEMLLEKMCEEASLETYSDNITIVLVELSL